MTPESLDVLLYEFSQVNKIHLGTFLGQNHTPLLFQSMRKEPNL